MNVRLGWSGDIHGTWTKMDVEVDDNDLMQFFQDNNLDPETASFSSIEKFKIMFSVAEVFVQLHKMTKFPEYFNNDDGRKDLGELLDMQKSLTTAIRERSVRS